MKRVRGGADGVLSRDLSGASALQKIASPSSRIAHTLLAIFFCRRLFLLKNLQARPPWAVCHLLSKMYELLSVCLLRLLGTIHLAIYCGSLWLGRAYNMVYFGPLSKISGRIQGGGEGRGSRGEGAHDILPGEHKTENHLDPPPPSPIFARSEREREREATHLTGLSRQEETISFPVYSLLTAWSKQ